MGRCLLSMYKVLGSMPSTPRKQRPGQSSTHYYTSALLTPPYLKANSTCTATCSIRKKTAKRINLVCSHRIRKKQTALRGKLQRGGESFMVLTVSPLLSPRCQYKMSKQRKSLSADSFQSRQRSCGALSEAQDRTHGTMHCISRKEHKPYSTELRESQQHLLRA